MCVRLYTNIVDPWSRRGLEAPTLCTVENLHTTFSQPSIVQFLHICVSASEDSSNPGSCSPTVFIIEKKKKPEYLSGLEAVTCAAQGSSVLRHPP